MKTPKFCFFKMTLFCPKGLFFNEYRRDLNTRTHPPLWRRGLTFTLRGLTHSISDSMFTGRRSWRVVPTGRHWHHNPSDSSERQRMYYPFILFSCFTSSDNCLKYESQHGQNCFFNVFFICCMGFSRLEDVFEYESKRGQN